jgi:hypothetical protein
MVQTLLQKFIRAQNHLIKVNSHNEKNLNFLLLKKEQIKIFQIKQEEDNVERIEELGKLRS